MKLLVFTDDEGQVVGAVVGDPIRDGDTVIQASPPSRTTPDAALRSQEVNVVEVDAELLRSSPDEVLTHLQTVLAES